MDRKQELIEIIRHGEHDEAIACRLIDEVVFLERRLVELREYPFLAINPKNPEQQRQTPAAKQYKELLQQYTNAIKILMKMSGDSECVEESPLRAFMKKLNAGADL
jgi:hypothetical protein